MKLLDTFLSEICAHPHDLGHRAAFADWLSEQPDIALQERGEFIALQLQLEAGNVRTQDRRRMRERERQLLLRYEKEWTTALRALGSIERWTFRNGMVEGVAARGRLFPEAVAQALFELAPITDLTLTGGLEDDDVRSLGQSPVLERITSLTIVRPGFLTECFCWLLDVLTTKKSITRLVLDDVDLAPDNWNALAAWDGLPHLHELSLRRTNANFEGVRRLLMSPYLDPARGPISLTRLDLRDNLRFQLPEVRQLHTALASRWDSPTFSGIRESMELIQRGVRPNKFAEHVQRIGSAGTPLLIDTLSHSSLELRQLAAAYLERRQINSEDLPRLVRRFYEPGMASAIRPILERLCPEQPWRSVRDWLRAFLSSDDATFAFEQTAMKSANLSPEAVRREFGALCARRLKWRASHGRGASLEVDDAPRELPALAALVADRAADAAERHSLTNEKEGDRTLTRTLARGKEYAFLAEWLLRLLIRHEIEAS